MEETDSLLIVRSVLMSPVHFFVELRTDEGPANPLLVCAHTRKYQVSANQGGYLSVSGHVVPYLNWAQYWEQQFARFSYPVREGCSGSVRCSDSDFS